MNDLSIKLENVNARIARACVASSRKPGEIRLLAVSKGQSATAIRQLYALGQGAFGENYLQEALPKQQALQDLDIEWHFIGAIQSNKTSDIARHFQWVHSVDRERILRRLSASRPAAGPLLNICLQVNIDGEAGKSGAPPASAAALAQIAAALPGIRLRGLMAIPQPASEGGNPAESFIAMRRLFDSLRADGLDLDTLSMGMSADLEQAIEAGTTMVRIGTDLFGPRRSIKTPVMGRMEN